MNITDVASTTLATIAYDDVPRLLRVEFQSGAVYEYFGVPATVHQALLGAPSKGIFFNQAIRGQFSFVRISALGADTQLGQQRPGGMSWRVP